MPAADKEVLCLKKLRSVHLCRSCHILLRSEKTLNFSFQSLWDFLLALVQLQTSTFLLVFCVPNPGFSQSYDKYALLQALALYSG